VDALDDPVVAHAPHAAQRDQEQWSAAVARARAAFVAARDLTAGWRASGQAGRIVLVSSPPAVRVVEGAGLAAVAGAFVTTLGQVAAADLGATGLRVNTVVAGWTEGDADPAFAAGTALGRLAEPAEVAASIAHLLSEGASYVTGATLVADGGFSITKAAGGSPYLTTTR